jgi:hypothetical protein
VPAVCRIDQSAQLHAAAADCDQLLLDLIFFSAPVSAAAFREASGAGIVLASVGRRHRPRQQRDGVPGFDRPLRLLLRLADKDLQQRYAFRLLSIPVLHRAEPGADVRALIGPHLDHPRAVLHAFVVVCQCNELHRIKFCNGRLHVGRDISVAVASDHLHGELHRSRGNCAVHGHWLWRPRRSPRGFLHAIVELHGRRRPDDHADEHRLLNDTIATCASPQFCSPGSATCLYNAITGDITASPRLVGSGKSTTLSWSTTDAASCTVTGTNGDTWNGTSGSRTSSPVMQVTTYTLACDDADPDTSEDDFTDRVTVVRVPSWLEF